MPEPDYAGFQSDPSSILTFMQDNLIATGMLPNSQQNSVPEYLALNKTTIPVVKDGREVGFVYYLKATDKADTNNALFSYICDYEKNHTRYCMLGTAAKFCFTITMNGCTFGIGMPNSSGHVIVSHSNRAMDDNQAQSQREITLGGHKNQQVTMLEPSMYRPVSRMTCTTFGIKTGGAWKFYFQSYRPNGGTWDYFGTIPIQSQRMTG